MSSAAQEAPMLEPERSIERQISGGGVHVYKVALTIGQYLRVFVDQRGIDLVLALRGPDGVQLTQMDVLWGSLGTEELGWEAGITAVYFLEVRAKTRAANTGGYEVRIEKAVAVSLQDRVRIAAARLLMEGVQADREDVIDIAINKYTAAIEQWRAIGGQKWEGHTLLNLGSVYVKRSEYLKAMKCYEEALKIHHETRNQLDEGAALNGLGNVYRYLNQESKALEYYEHALAAWRDIKNRDGEATALNGLGTLYLDRSQNEEALKFYEQALAISRETKNQDGEGLALLNAGMAHSNLSQNEKARDHFEQALTIWRGSGDRRGVASVLNSLGILNRNLSQNEKAIEFYEESLALAKEINDRISEGQALNNLGEVSSGLQQNEKARDYYEQSLAIWRQIGSRVREGSALNNLGVIYMRLGQGQKALGYYEQALEISREFNNKQVEGQVLNNLAEVYWALGQKQKTLESFQHSLAIWRELKDRQHEGSAHKNLGLLNRVLGQYDIAIQHYEEALAIRHQIGDLDGEVDALVALASLERRGGNLPEALKRIESALSTIENLRNTYANQKLRSVYFSNVRDDYDFYIDLLMYLHKQQPAAGYDAAALQASERSRARALLDSLAEASANIREGVDPQLVDRERSLQQRLNADAQLQMHLLGGSHTEQQASAVAREIEDLTDKYQTIEAQIRRNSPRYAMLTHPVSLGLKEIQQLLDQDTMLLEYAPGSDRSYFWAVTRTEISSYELPKAEEIERLARRVYESISTNNGTANRDYADAASSLSEMLLGPVAAKLGNKRLLFVSEGYLQYVPFAALPEPHVSDATQTRADTKNGSAGARPMRPLIAAHEVVSLPSASLLAVLRQERVGRSSATKQVAVLADPVFDPNDLRVKPAAEKRVLSLPRELERSAIDAGVLGFDRLRSTRDEAEQIISLTRPGESLLALDFDASRVTALSGQLSRYRIVHFATHGLLNSQHPELSGLVLSLVDEHGQSQDGFLRAHEVYNLKLNADLVVLSACQTALGKEVRGEGLVGLTRGLMYAGSPRVVASLWQVPSKATAELMKRFYRLMLAEGLRPAAALRGAQVEMWKQKQWNEPYYWAAFVLQGEWR